MNNLLQTSSKEYQERIFSFLLDSFSHEHFGLEGIELSDRQKIDYIFTDFDELANYPYNKKRFPNEQLRLANYLMDLHNAIYIPFYKAHILDTAKKLHNTDTFTQAEQNTIISNWWNHIAYMLIKMRTEL